MGNLCCLPKQGQLEDIHPSELADKYYTSHKLNRYTIVKIEDIA